MYMTMYLCGYILRREVCGRLHLTLRRFQLGDRALELDDLQPEALDRVTLEAVSLRVVGRAGRMGRVDA